MIGSLMSRWGKVRKTFLLTAGMGAPLGPGPPYRGPGTPGILRPAAAPRHSCTPPEEEPRRGEARPRRRRPRVGVGVVGPDAGEPLPARAVGPRRAEEVDAEPSADGGAEGAPVHEERHEPPGPAARAPRLDEGVPREGQDEEPAAEEGREADGRRRGEAERAEGADPAGDEHREAREGEGREEGAPRLPGDGRDGGPREKEGPPHEGRGPAPTAGCGHGDGDREGGGGDRDRGGGGGHQGAIRGLSP